MRNHRRSAFLAKRLDAQWDHEPIGAPTWSRLKAFATSKAGYKPALRALRFMGSLHFQRLDAHGDHERPTLNAQGSTKPLVGFNLRGLSGVRIEHSGAPLRAPKATAFNSAPFAKPPRPLRRNGPGNAAVRSGQTTPCIHTLLVTERSVYAAETPAAVALRNFPTRRDTPRLRQPEGCAPPRHGSGRCRKRPGAVKIACKTGPLALTNGLSGLWNSANERKRAKQHRATGGCLGSLGFADVKPSCSNCPLG